MAHTVAAARWQTIHITRAEDGSLAAGSLKSWFAKASSAFTEAVPIAVADRARQTSRAMLSFKTRLAKTFAIFAHAMA